MDTTATEPATQNAILDFLILGGPAIWAIIALSIFTLAIILWKLWHLSTMKVWSTEEADTAVSAWNNGDAEAADRLDATGPALSQVAAAAFASRSAGLSDADARDETSRVARNLLAEARTGLRALELIATVAPLIGLLGTVLGMIEAFQALETTGTRADPAALAGGIWEALLTTAAGMAVAIPASAALSWFDSIADRLRLSMEDVATRVLARPAPTLQAVPDAIHA
ncbi:MAG: MotA/TolQ/ExbB proton channel family protein [Pseudomonadota bacterium]